MTDPLLAPGNACASEPISRGGHFPSCPDYH